jgi:transcriptional regulator with XRE-family HTH domain
VSLGGAIRERRLAHNLTLVALAEQAGLSQPFLSQVENGRAKPSMDSLHRIAQALGTTPQALFSIQPDGAPTPQPTEVRAGDPSVPTIERRGESLRRLLLPGDAPFHVVELVGLATEYLDPWVHEGFEALYVLAGPIEVEIDGVSRTLDTGDFVSYPASLPHRHRSSLGDAARVLLVETQLHTAQQGAHSAT